MGHWIYRQLLRLYPRRFRERFGTQMEADFRALRSGGRARAWGVALRDIAASAPREHLRRRADRRRPWAAIGEDFGHALRVLRRRPGPALAVVAMLALGIGAATALFSVLHAVVLSPLPYAEPDRLVRIWEVTPQGEDFSTSDPNFLDFAARNRTLDGMAAMAWGTRTLLSDGTPERLTVSRVTANYPDLLGVEPVVGRTFTDAEGRPGGDAVVLLGQGWWERRFGADPAIVGRTLILDGQPYEVVGVLPGGIRFPQDPEAWLPYVPDPSLARDDHDINAIGRLRPGVSVREAQADLMRVAEELGRERPQTNESWSVRIESFGDWIIGPRLRTMMVVLLLAGGLLLLVACTNASNLLLVRATERDREIGVRAAVGADRGRIVRQLVLESVILALAAGGIGVGLAYGGVPLLARLAPAGIPRLDEATVDPVVLLFAVSVSLAVGIGFGLVPALHAVRRDLFRSLRSGVRVDAGRGRRARRLMLVAQLALATVVLVGAALLRTSFARLQAVDIGFDADRIIAVPIGMTAARYQDCPAGDCDAAMRARTAFLADALGRISALPGVTAAGATNISPLTGSSTVIDITVEGEPPIAASDARFADWRAVTEGYFDALGLEVLAGRTFRPEEVRNGVDIAVVSKAFAEEFMDGDAVGRRFAFGTNGTNWRRIVGVVSDIRDQTVEADARPMLYYPHGFFPIPYMTLLIRTDRSAEAIAPALRSTLAGVDPAMPVPVIRPLSGYRADATSGSRFAMTLMTLFAAAALVLAVLGVYAVTLYDVTRRTREFGLRVVLGAQRDVLLRQVLRDALAPLAWGLLLGLAAAAAGSGILRSTLFGTEPLEPIAYVAAALVLAAVALLAGMLPAWRATRVDPARALAAE